VEGGEPLRPLDEHFHMIEPLFQTMQNFKNEEMIGDGLTQGMNVTGHALCNTPCL
jgi:hypothetical protein